MITGFVFEDDLHLLRKKQSDGKLFILSVPYCVSFKLEGEDMAVTVPSGFKTDFASVPKVVPKWIAENLDSVEGAIVHDWLCVEQPEWSTSDIAADIFLTAMGSVGKIKRTYMYRAVKWFGPKW